MASWLYERYFSRLYGKEFDGRTFAYAPLISIVIPVYNPPQQYLHAVVESVRRQRYGRWQLCIADDASTAPHVRPYLERLQSAEPRAKVVFLAENQHIARATNAAMQVAEGDYLLFVDNDDVLFTPWALSALVESLQDDRSDLVYADNVMIDGRGAVQSFAMKPDWDTEFLQSTCYVTHPLMVRRMLMEKLGGFRHECTSAQDIDLLDRATLLDPKVRHIPKFLYGWRMLPGSVTTSTDAKPEIIARSLRAHNDQLQSRGAAAVSVWPSFFQKNHIGAFKLQFPSFDRRIDSLALVLLSHGETLNSATDDRSRRIVSYPISDAIHLSTADSASCDALKDRLSRSMSEYVLFLDSSIDATYTSAVDELLGYLLLDPRIGIVAGKVLDDDHRIRASSYVFHAGLSMLGEGHRDADFCGYWYKSRLAHNTLAVPGRFFVTRTQLVADYGLSFDVFGDFAVPDLCLRLRDVGLRTVYNPWAVALSQGFDDATANVHGRELFARTYHRFFGKDPYYRSL